jgi:hypothetical protein
LKCNYRKRSSGIYFWNVFSHKVIK